MVIEGGGAARLGRRDVAAAIVRGILLPVALATIALACDALSPAVQGGDPAPSGPGLDGVERGFGPTYAERPAGGRAVRIDRATLRADRQILVVEFIGGKTFDPANSCSAAYEPWLAARAEELDVEVVELPRGLAGFGGACTAEGYVHVYGLRLTQPFAGTTVNDLGSGGSLLVGSRNDTAAPTKLPDGWELRLALAEEPGPPPTWVQVYARAPVPAEPPYDGPGRIVLHQAFGLTDEWSGLGGEKARERGARPTAVTIAGQPTTLWDDPGSGELLVAWTLEGRNVALVANSADLTRGELLRIAESVTIP